MVATKSQSPTRRALRGLPEMAAVPEGVGQSSAEGGDGNQRSDNIGDGDPRCLRGVSTQGKVFADL